MARRLELIKIVARAIVAERDESGQIVAESETDAAALYTPDQVAAYYENMRQQVAEQNKTIEAYEAERAKPNRAARRARTPRKRSK